MAPTVRSVSSGGGDNAVTVAPAKPSGLAVGDLLLAFQESDADGDLASMTAPSGFTALGAGVTPNGSTNIPACKLWRKVATSTDVAASTFSFPDAGGANCSVVLVAITAGTFDATTPTGTPVFSSQGNASGTSITAPAVSPGVVGALLLTGHMPDTGGTLRSFSAAPSGMTLVAESTAGSSTYTRIGVYSQTLASTAATGTKAATLSGTMNGWGTVSVLVNPLSGTTFTRAGGAAAAAIGSGSVTVAHATTRTRAGAAATAAAGSGTRVVGHTFTRTGAGASAAAGTATRIVTVPRLRGGGAGARAASVGAVTVFNVPPDLKPSDVLDLSYWHLTTPEDDGDGTAEQIDQPELDDYETDNFFADTVNGQPCVVFRADVDGFSTSEASGATRMELRQHRKGTYALAAIDPTGSGRWQLTITTRPDATSVTGGSNPRQELIIAQIHGAGDSPIPLILSAEFDTVSEYRVRIFKNGPGVGDLIRPFNIDDPLSIRIRIEDERLKVWGVLGEVTDLPSVETSTPWDWPVSDFTDQEGWYYKDGAYHKTSITSNSSGFGIAKVTYLNVLEPGDPEEVFSTTYELAGGSGASAAGSGARSLVSAQVFTRTGAAGAAAAGTAAAQIVPAITYTRAGGSAFSGSATGTRALAPATTYNRAGASGASATGVALGDADLHAEHDVLGGVAAGAAGSGSVEHVAPARIDTAGAAAASAAGSGARDIDSSVVYELSGAAGVAGGARGSRQLGGGTEYSRDGSAAVALASAGAVDVASPATYERSGGAAPALAGAGAVAVQSAEAHTRTGGAASSPAAAGELELVRPAVRTRAGSAGAVPAGSGAADVESSGTSYARIGAGAAAAGASGSAEVVPAARHDRSGGSAGTAAGVCLLEVIESPIHVREGGSAAVVACAGRARRGGRFRAAVPVALGQFRAGTPVRR